MADRLQLLVEAERRGILPPDQAGLLAEARKRGLVAVPSADEAIAARNAGTSTVVQTDRLARAQQLRDMGLEDPRSLDNPDVPIEGFMRTVVPPVLPAKETNFGATLKADLASDPDTKRRLAAQSLFPNDPNGASRIGFVDDKMVYVDEGGQLREVSPGLARFGASVVANAPEIGGAIIGSAATGFPVLGAAFGGALGRILKRSGMGLAVDEPVTAGGLAQEAAGEAATNVVGGVLGKGAVALADRAKIVDLASRNVATAEQARDYIRRTTGINVDLAQATGDRRLIALRAYAARYPGQSADLIQAADEAANGQLDTAVERVLNIVAKGQPSEVAGMAGANAAQTAITAARAAVQKIVRPLYDKAYAAVPVVDRTTRQGNEILDFLKLPYFGEAFSAGQRLRALETGSAAKPSTVSTQTLSRGTPEEWSRATTTVRSTPTGAKTITSKMSEGTRKETNDGVLTSRDETVVRDITQPSLEELDYTKRALDIQIEDMLAKGQRQRARALKIKRDEFVAALDNLPSSEWKAARAEYARLAKSTLEPLEQGLVGVLAQVRSPKAAAAAAKIFNDPNITASQIRATRATFLQQEGGEEAWNGLARLWVARAWNKAQKMTQTGDAVNPAGKLRQALIGTPSQKANMEAALGPGSVQAFDDLMTALQALARTPTAGSNTYRDQTIGEMLKGQAAVLFKWITSPRKAVTDAAEQRLMERNVVAITEALLDPAKRNQLRIVVKMQDRTKQAILLTSILGTTGVAKAAVPEDDQVPLSPRR